VPVDLAIITKPIQQPMVKLLPHAGLLPGAQGAPTGDPAAASQVPGRAATPGGAGAQRIDEAAEHCTVGDPGDRSWLGWVGGQQWDILASRLSLRTSCSAMRGECT
jgi:hypothetical protein